jgi:hypothetical protein
MTAHLLRAFTLWLAVAPVLIVPLLVGGVAAADIGFALALEVGVVLGSVAAGFLASSLAEKWGSAMALATLLAILIGEGLALLSVVSFAPLFLANEKSARGQFLLIALIGPWILGTGLMQGGFSGLLAQSPPWMDYGLMAALGMVVLGSIAAITIAWRFAALCVQRLGHGDVLTPRHEAPWRFWFKPRLPRLIRWRRESLLLRNPVVWLYTLDPVGRLARWGWCALVIAVWCGVLIAGMENDDTEPWVFGLPIMLIIGMAFSASASFRRELEEGTFELLLVTPIRPAAILSARIFALWAEFVPSVLLSAALALLWMAAHGDKLANIAILAIVASSFITVPFLGARFSVRRLSPLTGWLWTLGLAAVLLAVFGLLLTFVSESTGEHEEAWCFSTRFVLSFLSMQFVEAGCCAWATINDLATRKFQLKPLRRVPG